MSNIARGPESDQDEAALVRHYGFVLLAAIAIIVPLWIVDIPGMVDYPNHLVRCFILSRFSGNPLWQQTFVRDFSPIHNHAIDLIVTPLLRWFPLIVAGKIFLTITALLYVIGCAELGQAILGRPHPLSPAAAFTFYNSSLLFGFVNYVFGLGVFLCTLACWLRFRERMSAWRFAVLCVLAAAAYVAHLSSIAFLGISCTTVALFDLRRNRNFGRFVLNLAWLAPPVILMKVFLHGNGSVGKIEWSSMTEKVVYLLSPVRSYSAVLDVILIAGLIVIALAIRKGMHLHPLAAAGCVMIALLFLTPKVLFTSSAADARFSVPGFLLLILAVDPGRGRRVKIATIVASALMFVHTAGIAMTWMRIDRRSHEMLQMGDVLPEHARIYVVQPTSPGIDKTDRGLDQVAELWTVSRGATLSSLFAIAGQQPLIFRKPPYTGPDWIGHLADYDFIWTQDSPPEMKRELAVIATPAAIWESVTLWRIRR